jgi:hypothetical protein
MPAHPDIEESRARLLAAGWSVLWEGRSYRDGGAVYRVRVEGGDGRTVTGEGVSEAEAWHRAAEQALGVGGGQEVSHFRGQE